MTIATEILLIIALVLAGAYGVGKRLRQLEKRFDEQQKIFEELKTELENLRDVLDGMRHDFDNEGEEETP